MFKKFTGTLALLLITACSKTVSKDGYRFAQENPGTPPTDPVGCEPDRLGELLDYSLYAKGDVKVEDAKIGGRVAANYACFQHSQIGSRLPANASRVDLASAGKLGVDVTKIPHGKATYGSTLERVNSSALGKFTKAPLDLSTNLEKISEFSHGCAGESTNTKITRTCHTGKVGLPESPGTEICSVRISGQHPVMNIAELAPPQLSNAMTYVIDIPEGSSLVINLPDNRIAIFRGIEVLFAARTAESPTNGRIFWNFPSADSLEFNGTIFHGTIVAPDAKVKVTRQAGEAGFWVSELSATDSNW